MIIRYKYIVFTLITLLLTRVTYSQIILADSLVYALKAAKNDKKKILILNQLSTSLSKNTPQHAFEYNKQAIALAQKTKDTYQLSEAYQNLAGIYRVLGDYDKGLEYSLKGLEIAEKYNYDTLTIRSLGNISTFNFFLSQNDTTYNRKGFEYLIKARTLAQKIGAGKLLATNYLNTGDVYRTQEKYDSALVYTDKAFLLASEFGDIDIKGLAMVNKGQILVERAKYVEALPFLSRSYEYLMSVDNRFDASFALQMTGIAHRELKQYDKAFSLLNEALSLSQELDSKSDIADIYQQLYMTAEKVGNTAQAFGYYKKFHLYNDSIFNEAKSRQIAAMQSLHDEESKDKEIELLKKHELVGEEALQKQRFLIAFLLSIFAFICLVTGFLYRNNRNKQKINKILETQNTEILRQQGQIEVQRENIVLQNAELEVKNNELSFLNEEKNYLIGVVAHDLRNPLNQVKGLINLMQMYDEGIPKEEKDEYMRLIKEAIDRMTGMISKTLDVNAIDAKKINLMKEKQDISAILHTVGNNFENVAKDKNIAIERQIDEAIIVENLDKNYLTQVFENLISNAIKYSPPNSKVHLKASRKGDFARIEVQDHGQGISEEDKKKMFGKFQKLSAKPTQGEKSVGLGLSIVKKYVEAMGGKVWCESEIGKGAIFIVEF